VGNAATHHGDRSRGDYTADLGGHTTCEPKGPVKLVNASRGKVQRAEPVAAIYAQGKVRHVGHFAELEQQYCHFSTAGQRRVSTALRHSDTIFNEYFGLSLLVC
jgi:phage terminase large subunit-like protein